MQEFIEQQNFSRRLLYKGVFYVVLHSLANGYYIVAREGYKMPTEVYVIHNEDENDKR